jgi:ornithine cyclodeaminase/alanine dehydrogenase-like protein (mu-crystallin family)
MTDAIAAVRDAFVALSAGRAVVPVRTAVPLPSEGAVFLAMPASLPGRPAMGAKLVSVLPENPRAGRPIVQAVVVLMDPRTGSAAAVIEGTGLTALRTGAASGLATDLLARRDAGIIALFGAGAQARTQLEAVCAVRDVTQVRVVARTPGPAETFARWAREQPWIRGATVLAASSPEAAARGAEIVVTATGSATPVVPGHAIGAGAHINAVGAFQAHTRELDSDVVARSVIVVDSRVAALAEAGDLVIPLGEGRISGAETWAEIGEVAAGRHGGRRTPQDTTLFKSVGNAVQDLAVGALALERAVASGRGTRVSLADAPSDGRT